MQMMNMNVVQFTRASAPAHGGNQTLRGTGHTAQMDMIA
jgi:hypothetical protein